MSADIRTVNTAIRDGRVRTRFAAGREGFCPLLLAGRYAPGGGDELTDNSEWVGRFHRAGRPIPLSVNGVVGLDHELVSVQKAIDLNGSGETIQEAVAEALDRARLSLEGITSFEVQRISGVVDESTTTYQVELKVWFTLLERMHG